MSTEVRADALKVGDIYREDGDDEPLKIASLAWHGDRLLLMVHGEEPIEYETSLDCDTVVELIAHEPPRHPASCYPCKGTGRVVGFGAANGGPCPADHTTEG